MATMPATSQPSSRRSTPPPPIGNSARSNAAWVRNGEMIPSPLLSSTATTITTSCPRYAVNRAHTRRPSRSSRGDGDPMRRAWHVPRGRAPQWHRTVGNRTAQDTTRTLFGAGADAPASTLAIIHCVGSTMARSSAATSPSTRRAAVSEIHDVPARGGAAAPDDVSARIQAVLDDRRRSVPRVRAEIEWWLRVDDQLAGLAAAVRELGGHQNTPAELRDALAGFRVEEAREGVADAVRLLRVLESRFSRATLNIGVSGQARVGKSTLLQSISGLDDGQIPTGKGLPVTAVRSRIFHSAQHQ